MIHILAIIGLILSIYALAVKIKLKNKSYKPVCDINNKISCSKAFNSKYANLFKVPNAAVGMIYYIFLLLPAPHVITLIAAIAAAIISLFLAYISYIKQKNFCLVCTATYIVNIAILATLLL